MDSSETRRYEMFVRVRQFGADNAADFPRGSVGAAQFAVIADEIAKIEAASAGQAAGSGGAKQDFATKETARENLREAVYEIVRTARSMKYQFDGIDAKFRMPPSLSDQKLLATARAFYEESLDYDADFLSYGLPDAFRADLQSDIDAFDASMNPTGTSIDRQVAATAEIGEAVRRAMTARRILEGVVQNRYRSNVGKLAAWTSASHIERADRSAVPKVKN